MKYMVKRAGVYTVVLVLSPAVLIGVVFELLRGGFEMGSLLGNAAMRSLLDKLK